MSNARKYTGTAGKAIGTLVGSYFGGPMGGMAGGAVGESVGDKFGGVIDGDVDWTALLSPGPEQQGPAEPFILDPQNRMGMGTTAPEMGVLSNSSAMAAGSDFDFGNMMGSNMASDSNGGAKPDAGKSFDFGKFLTGAGQLVSGTAAGMQGDTDYFSRLQARMDQASSRQQQLKLQTERAEEDRLNKAAQRREGILKSLETAMKISKTVGGDPEKAKLVAPLLAQSFGGLLSDEDTAQLLTEGDSSFKALTNLHRGLSAAAKNDPAFAKQLEKQFQAGNIDAKEAVALGKERSNDAAFQAISAFIEKDPERAKTMTNADWEKVPGMEDLFEFLSEGNAYRLQEKGAAGLKPVAQIKKEKESDVIEGRQRDLRADTEANVERRHQEDLAERRRSGARLEAQSAANIALGQGNLAMREKEFEGREEVRGRLSNSEREPLDNMQQAFRLTKELRDAHAEATKGDKPISGAMRGYLMEIANSAPRKMTQITREQLDKLSPAERKAMAKLNTVVGNLRAMTPERQLSNEDAIRNLSSFMLSNSPKQVQANLGERLRDQEMSFNQRRDSIRGQGKNVEGYDRIDSQVGAATPATSAAATPATTPSDRPRRRNPQTGEVVEFDGKAWVKVK